MSVATPRREQIEHARGARRRQLARAAKIEELLAPWHDDEFGRWSEGKGLRTHHGWGVCVKVRDCYCTCNWDSLEHANRGACTCGYEWAREIFWDDLGHIASEYDFRGVYTEGRSGGYALVDPQPGFDDMYPREQTEFMRERLAPFVLDVLEYMAEARKLFKQGKLVTGETIAEALAERE